MRKKLATHTKAAMVIAAIVVALVIAGVFAACTLYNFGRVPIPWNFGEESVLWMDETDNGNQFTLAPGMFFEIRLKENLTTPYKWSLVEYDHSVVIKVRDFYDADWAPPGTGGSGGTHIWRFQAVGLGVQSPIRIVHHRIDQKPGHYKGQPYSITVDVDSHVD